MKIVLKRIAPKMNNVFLRTSMLVALCISSTHVYSQQLYKWVDDQGVTHYGDALPDENIQHESFKFAEYTQVSSPGDDYYSIHNQLQRLQERRAESLKQKQQAAEIKAAKNPPVQEVIVTNNEPARRYYAPAYFPRHFDKRYKYIPGHPHYNRHTNQTVQHKTVAERPRGGLVLQPKTNRSKAVFTKSK